jgi:hypothetical protein
MFAAVAVAYFAPNVIMSIPLVNKVAVKSYSLGQSF